MANQYKNKVVYNGTTLIDLSQDTVTDASHILKGYVGHLANGTQVTGTAESGGGSVTWETLYEGSATIVSSSPNYISIMPFPETINEGETWRITWNGTPYTCTAVYSSRISGCYVGNAHIVDSGSSDTGEPFWAYKRTATQLAFSTNQSAGTITLIIERQTTSSATLITKTITANGTYSAEDDSADGYSSVTVNVSGGSGLEYETGTYTAAANERPEISFANSHSTAPDILIFADASASAPSTGNALSAYCYFNYQSLFGVALATPTAQNAAYGYGRLASNLNYSSALVNDTTSNVTSSGFKPFAGTTAFTCKSGQTYKWIAIWK